MLTESAFCFYTFYPVIYPNSTWLTMLSRYSCLPLPGSAGAPIRLREYQHQTEQHPQGVLIEEALAPSGSVTIRL